ncbi:hypothetical protein TSUD_375900 [Trifolium subterraneum]|uniref:Aminotransferase-like plant mobile domain-containing protein n=1 Tax=Trifolium subterraneum TaxID=3900 RepID=A0A2Z6N861_TRISU|nr:hypothetical protein TSUD_375900 [Trifolium subterraneum]
MTDEVGRTRGGRESRAHGSARRKLVNVDKIPRRAKGKTVAGATDTEASGRAKLAIVFSLTEAQRELEPDGQEEEKDVWNDHLEAGEEELEEGEEVSDFIEDYGGGPTDLSLLSGYGKHVAAALWRGECKKRYLRCMNNDKRINDYSLLNKEMKWFWNVIDATGLRPLLKTNYNNLEWGLLTAFTERWQLKTGIFHLPIGEVTITLDDVSFLLHIPIITKILNHKGMACTTEEGEDMCYEYLNFPRTKCRAEFKKMKGAHIGFSMLEKIYAANIRRALKAEKYKESEEVVLAWLTHGTGVLLGWHICITIWKNQVARAVETMVVTIAWIYEHFKRFGGGWVSEKYSNRDPICAKYCPLKGYKYPDEHKTPLDRMEVDEVTFRTYEDHRHIHPFEDICCLFPDTLMNLEVLIEEDNAAEKQDVFEICRTVIAEVKGKLDGELTLEEAREVLQKVERDLVHVATYSLPVKWKRDSSDGRKKRKKKKKCT